MSKIVNINIELSKINPIVDYPTFNYNNHGTLMNLAYKKNFS
jgi:hypothetical protein